MRYALTSLALLFLCGATAAFADRPTGDEIATKAKAARFDRGNSTTAMIKGKRVQVTPAESTGDKSESELEMGQVIGELDTELAGDETNLPPGKYNLYLAKVGNTWSVFAESDGKIVTEIKNVKVEKDPNPNTKKKPKISEVGWTFSLCAWGICATLTV